MIRRVEITMMFLRSLCSASASVALLLALAACGGGGEDAPPSAPPPGPPPAAGLQPTFTSIQNNVFTPNCAKSTCHTGAVAPFGLRLDPGFSYANLYMIASAENASLFRVNPMDPDQSYVIQKLEGALGIIGNRMPADGPPYLQQATIDVIRQWIQNGALNN
jgi:hypothetical protein